jgi:predicted heme/steroid binding protein
MFVLKRPFPWMLLSLVVVLLAVPTESVRALPDFAAETGLACGECHEGGADGGPLTEFGEEYMDRGYALPEEAAEQSPQQSAASRWLRGLVRFVHLAVGVVWFGAIAYIHLFMGPRKLSKGLPRAEMRLGWFSIAVMAITGTLLSIWKLGSVEELWSTAFGAVWRVKVGAFLALVVVAAIATTALNRRMRRAAEVGGPGACGLIRFAYGGKLYDATGSKWWEGGTHAGRHRAGTDLTEAMADAPHGPEVLDHVKLVGPVAKGCCKEGLPAAAKAFVVLAYVNLGLIAIVLFCVSFWGWGLALIG